MVRSLILALALLSSCVLSLSNAIQIHTDDKLLSAAETAGEHLAFADAENDIKDSEIQQDEINFVHTSDTSSDYEKDSSEENVNNKAKEEKRQEPAVDKNGEKETTSTKAPTSAATKPNSTSDTLILTKPEPKSEGKIISENQKKINYSATEAIVGVVVSMAVVGVAALFVRNRRLQSLALEEEEKSDDLDDGIYVARSERISNETF